MSSFFVIWTKKTVIAYVIGNYGLSGPIYSIPGRLGVARGALRPFFRRSALTYSALTYSALEYGLILPFRRRHV